MSWDDDYSEYDDIDGYEEQEVRPVRRNRNRKRRRRRASPLVAILGLAVIALSGVIVLLAVRLHQVTRQDQTVAAESMEDREAGSGVDPQSDEFWNGSPELDVQLLTPNEYSRPQIPLDRIDGIVVHYTANPGSTAQENRDYFEGLKSGASGNKVSSHFIIGLDGEIIQCIPSSEIAYCSNSANDYTLSIECCHPDESGEFTQATYDSLVKLVGWLSHVFGVERSGIIRHYDVTGKNCPKYFVEHEDAWERFRDASVDYRDSI